MIGAALVKAGTAPLLAPGIIKTAAFIIVSPLLGMLLGSLLMLGVSWLCFRQTPRRVDKLVPAAAAGFVRRLLRWATAATTRRRPWASSGCC